jgi:branched-chain amino acid transport system permease protein
MDRLADQMTTALGLGAMYALVAVGYTMVYGVLRLINFAHGEFFMVGAFAGYWLAKFGPPGASLQPSWLALTVQVVSILIVAGTASAVLGAVSERLVYRPLRGRGHVISALAGVWLAVCGIVAWPRLAAFSGNAVAAAFLLGGLWLLLWWLPRHLPRLDSPRPTGGRLAGLLAALGLSLALQTGAAYLFTATPRAWPALTVASAGPRTAEIEQVGGPLATITLADDTIKTVILIVLVVSTTVLALLVKWTRSGKAMRALSEKPDVAILMGVNVDRIVTRTFLIGAFLAGIGGALWALRYGKLEPYMGFMPGIKAFAAAVIGGIGSVPGAVVGGLLLGILETLAASYGLSAYRDAVAFIALIAILLVRPHGILGSSEGEKA